MTIAHGDSYEGPLMTVPDALASRVVTGRLLFGADWLRAAPVAGALGPHFDQSSCTGCHTEGGLLVSQGPGKPLHAKPVRIARLLDPVARIRYGAQLNTDALAGATPQGHLDVRFGFRDGRFNDGTPYRLRYPRSRTLTGRAGAADLATEVDSVGLRVAPTLFGWGLLQAVADEVLIRVSDPQDRTGNGISGRVIRVWDIAKRRDVIGRFGWKAEQPTLRQQIAAALHNDMGITTRLFPGECGEEASAGCGPELDDAQLDRLVEFLRYAGVPDRRRRNDPQVRHGEILFGRAGCTDCHLPVLITRPHRDPVFSEQIIWPYTDLLLHDMGPDLADPRAGSGENAREWRTPPLWGVGLVAEHLPGRRFLHDGRARSLLEAVLWHGGEAEKAKDRVLTLNRSERAALLAFLRSL